MFLHVGKGENIRLKNIIGIFDLDTATVSPATKSFIKEKQRVGSVEYADDDLPRSFVLYMSEKKAKIKLSRISPGGLKSRTRGEYMYFDTKK